jgi:hypothetical protein
VRLQGAQRYYGGGKASGTTAEQWRSTRLLLRSLLDMMERFLTTSSC